MYVVTAVQTPPPPGSGTVSFWLHAIDIRTGLEMNNPIQIQATATGNTNIDISLCTTQTDNGIITFDPSHHVQRAGLLLLTIGTTDFIYIAFGPFQGEIQNGWILGYSFTSSSDFSQVATFITTPYGTGGGVWKSGAGLAAGMNNGDPNTYIYAPTGNGTFDVSGAQYPSIDYGDSMLKLGVGTGSNGHGLGSLWVADYFTPSNVFSYSGGTGLCNNDEDFGSGGVVILPDSFYTGHPDLTVSADKQSNIYLINRDNLGQLNNGGPTQLLNYPTVTSMNTPGYWSSPAYWKYAVGNSYSYQIYYAPDEQNTAVKPYPLTMYSLTANGLPVSAPYPSTSTVFCAQPHAPIPSISSSGATQGSGVLWAIESSNIDNPHDCNVSSTTVGPAVLHAYNATPQTGTLQQLYSSSSNVITTPVGFTVNFPTPTIFSGRVYMTTRSLKVKSFNINGEVDVFGPCPVGGCLP